MEYVYSALVLHAAGKEVTEDAVSAVLKAAGIEPDISRIKALTASLEGVDIDEAIATAVAAPAEAPAAGAAPAADGGSTKEEEKEEEEEEVSEEEAAAGLGALFG